MEGVNVLVDPILVGNLDFGVPWLYDAAKKVLTNFRVIYSSYLLVLGFILIHVLYRGGLI